MRFLNEEGLQRLWGHIEDKFNKIGEITSNVGRNTEEGGEIFNDYVNNIAGIRGIKAGAIYNELIKETVDSKEIVGYNQQIINNSLTLSLYDFVPGNAKKIIQSLQNNQLTFTLHLKYVGTGDEHYFSEPTNVENEIYTYCAEDGSYGYVQVSINTQDYTITFVNHNLIVLDCIRCNFNCVYEDFNENRLTYLYSNKPIEDFPYGIGDKLNCDNGFHLVKRFQITNVQQSSNNTDLLLTIEDIGQPGTFKYQGMDGKIEDMDMETGCYFSCPDKPLAGDIIIPDKAMSAAAGEGNKSLGRASYVAGRSNVALQDGGTVFGRLNTAGYCGTSLGRNSHALGEYSFAGGYGGRANGNVGFSYGSNTQATGNFSSVLGKDLEVKGTGAHGTGIGGTVTGNYSFKANSYNSATKTNAFATGLNTTASGEQAFTTGQNTTASNTNTAAFGQDTTASGARAAAFGNASTASGTTSFVTGSNNTASGTNSFVAGAAESKATKNNSAAFGWKCEANADQSFVAGQQTVATGYASAGFGIKSTVSGQGSAVFGNNNQIAGNYNFGLGANNNISSGAGSGNLIIGGSNNITAKSNSLVLGYDNDNSGGNSLVIGYKCNSTADQGFVGGTSSIVNAANAGAFGIGLAQYSTGGFVVGKYNSNDTDALFAVGAGAANDARKNALKVDTNGVTYTRMAKDSELDIVATKGYVDNQKMKIDQEFDETSQNAQSGVAINAMFNEMLYNFKQSEVDTLGKMVQDIRTITLDNSVSYELATDYNTGNNYYVSSVLVTDENKKVINCDIEVIDSANLMSGTVGVKLIFGKPVSGTFNVRVFYFHW